MLGYFKNWNIIQLSHKSISYEAIDKINQFLLDRISDNMAALVKLVNMVPLIQQIQLRWATMSLNSCHYPAYYKKKHRTRDKSLHLLNQFPSPNT